MHRSQQLTYIQSRKEDYRDGQFASRMSAGPARSRAATVDAQGSVAHRRNLVSAECQRKKPPQRTEFCFSRKDVRASTAWSDSQRKETSAHVVEEWNILIAHHACAWPEACLRMVVERAGRQRQAAVTG